MFGWCWDGYWCWIGPRLKLQRRSQKMDGQVSGLWLPEVDPKITRQCRTDSWLQGWNMSTKFWRSGPLDMRLGWCPHHSHLAVPFLNGAVLTKVGGMQKVRTQFFNAVAFFVPTYSNPFSTGHIACQVGSNLICTQEMGAKFVWERISSVFRPHFPAAMWRDKCSSGFRISSSQVPLPVARAIWSLARCTSPALAEQWAMALRAWALRWWVACWAAPPQRSKCNWALIGTTMEGQSDSWWLWLWL